MTMLPDGVTFGTEAAGGGGPVPLAAAGLADGDPAAAGDAAAAAAAGDEAVAGFAAAAAGDAAAAAGGAGFAASAGLAGAVVGAGGAAAGAHATSTNRPLKSMAVQTAWAPWDRRRSRPGGLDALRSSM